MLFDINQIKKNRKRAGKIGKKNFIQRAALKNLEGRVIELGLSLRNVLVFGEVLSSHQVSELRWGEYLSQIHFEV